MEAGQVAEVTQAEPAEAETPLSIADMRRLLNDLGIGPFAAVIADSEQYARLQQLERRREFANRLGVAVEYVTDEMLLAVEEAQRG